MQGIILVITYQIENPRGFSEGKSEAGKQSNKLNASLK
jgi:hypothetical protein